MPAPIILQEFNETHPFTLDELNIILRALAGTINGLSGQQLINFTPFGGDDDTAYLPLDGGDLTGAITAPAIQVGLTGSQYPVVTTNDAPTLSVRGAVKKAAAVSLLGLNASNPPTEAEVQSVADRLDALITSLKNSGALA